MSLLIRHPCPVDRTIVSAFLFLTGCGMLPTGQEAPESCEFLDGTALSYAGSSTTAVLGVQEVMGDPMSDDPADIYITRGRVRPR